MSVMNNRSTKQAYLPHVTPEEMKRMLDCCTNLKHRTLLALMYSAGLKRREVLNLKLTDVLFDRLSIRVRDKIGDVDRHANLSKLLINDLQAYCNAYNPFKWLFEGNIPGDKYNVSSVGKVLTEAKFKAEIKRRITPSMLGQCYKKTSATK